LKAEWALRGAKRRSNPSNRERRAKPETEQALPRWGKACVFLNPLTGAITRLSHHSAFAMYYKGRVFETPGLIRNKTFHHGKKSFLAGLAISSRFGININRKREDSIKYQQ